MNSSKLAAPIMGWRMARSLTRAPSGSADDGQAGPIDQAKIVVSDSGGGDERRLNLRSDQPK
jgi:hypothetical protein